MIVHVLHLAAPATAVTKRVPDVPAICVRLPLSSSPNVFVSEMQPYTHNYHTLQAVTGRKGDLAAALETRELYRRRVNHPAVHNQYFPPSNPVLGKTLILMQYNSDNSTSPVPRYCFNDLTVLHGSKLRLFAISDV
jgi:hypothetical protein